MSEIQVTLSEEEKPKKQRRGFASMTEAKRRKVAAMGGKAAHERGTAHQWTSAEASAAGKKGGSAVRKFQRRKKAEK